MTSTTGQSAETRSVGGFTLLELIAVLVLISTVLAAASPFLRRFVHGRRTADAAARILSLTHLARSRAASCGSVHRLNVAAETGTYWLTMQRTGAFVEIERGHGRRHRLPLGTSVTVETAAEIEAEEVSHVQFYPDGRCDVVTIELTGPQGDILQVTSPSASQRFRVVSPAEDERQ